jgi:hypothetical protein
MVGHRRGILCASVRMLGMGGCLHRLGRHDCGCVVWVDVVGEGGEAVVSRVGGVWRKSGCVCRVGKCWEGHGVGEWQRILVGTLFARKLPSVSNVKVQNAGRRIRFALQSRCSRQCKLKRQSADDDAGDGTGWWDSLVMFDDVDGIVYNPPHPPNLSNPQSICHHCVNRAVPRFVSLSPPRLCPPLPKAFTNPILPHQQIDRGAL